MLRHDPIVLRFSELLPSEQEHIMLAQDLERSVAIGSAEATLWRYCWQSRRQAGPGVRGGRPGGARAHRAGAEPAGLGRSPEGAALHGGLPGSGRRILLGDAFQLPRGRQAGASRVHREIRGQVRAEAFGRLWSMGQALQQRERLAVNATVLFALRSFEYLTKVVMADETLRQGRVVDRVLFVSDFGGLQLSQLDASFHEYCKSMAKEMITLFPETLHCTIVANVPWIIAWNVWPLLRRLLHPVTQAKLLFLHSAGLRQKLLELVEPDQLPPYLGGSCCCRECVSGQMRGGSMRAWEEAEGAAGAAEAERAAASSSAGAARRPGGPLRVLTDCCCGGAEKSCSPGRPRRERRPLQGALPGRARGGGGEGAARGPRGSWAAGGPGCCPDGRAAAERRLLAAGTVRTRRSPSCPWPVSCCCRSPLPWCSSRRCRPGAHKGRAT
ncbi:unnamed protein product [Prorocentrum cordatum]|uniref:CRAL-TRIO domain-containing protein n=1 Tax=Prorocentrum cordatum TaxID=2364126 RepID=A0ABN9R5T1_9DINO|nr:unnamed protein product [Polarella glacialis]